MSSKNFCFSRGSRSLARTFAIGAMIGATLLLGAPTQAAFHLWNIREVYTDTNGTRQFIEFFTTSPSQNFVAGQQIRVFNANNTASNTFTIPSNFAGDTVSHAFLIATPGIQSSGAPVPDYTIPTNFIFSGGGTVTFFGANSGPYTALPIDGINSRTWTGGNAVNTPQNFAGQTGTITNGTANTPLFVSITNPPNNSLFAAPATVAVGVSATGSVANVQLLTNGVAAATNTVAPFGFTLSSLAAGNYTLNARAQDNGALSATSAPISIRVAIRPTVAFDRASNGPIQFRFNSVTGVNYVVERGAPLTNFLSVVTNAGSGGVLQFQETNSGATQRTYRVRLQ